MRTKPNTTTQTYDPQSCKSNCQKNTVVRFRGPFKKYKQAHCRHATMQIAELFFVSVRFGHCHPTHHLGTLMYIGKKWMWMWGYRLWKSAWAKMSARLTLRFIFVLTAINSFLFAVELTSINLLSSTISNTRSSAVLAAIASNRENEKREGQLSSLEPLAQQCHCSGMCFYSMLFLHVYIELCKLFLNPLICIFHIGEMNLRPGLKQTQKWHKQKFQNSLM